VAAARTVTPFPLECCCIPSFLPAVLASLRLCLATSMSVQRFFIAFGRVQQVMFRQTLMRAAIRRGLEAAASNSKISVRIIISSYHRSSDCSLVNRLPPCSATRSCSISRATTPRSSRSSTFCAPARR